MSSILSLNAVDNICIKLTPFYFFCNYLLRPGCQTCCILRGYANKLFVIHSLIILTYKLNVYSFAHNY